jgi:hypothetical protein
MPMPMPKILLYIVQIQEVYKATIQKLQDFVAKYKESADKKQRF